VAAAVQREMETVRNRMYFYGAYPTEWTPYRPGFDRRICAFAQNVVSTQNITSALASGEQGLLALSTLLERSRVQNEIVILLVDVWATKIDRYHRVLWEYDSRNEPTSGVLLPCSEDDEESNDRLEELRDELSRTFPNAMIRRDLAMFRDFIPNAEAFRKALLEVLAEAQSRIFRQGSVRRRAGGTQIMNRPILRMQGADDE
jgi:FxsC-like protein